MNSTMRSQNRTANWRRNLVRLSASLLLGGSLLGVGGAASNAAPPPDDPFDHPDPHQPEPAEPEDDSQQGENLPPVPVDDHYTTPMNTPLEVAAPGILANDSDPEGSVLTTDSSSLRVAGGGTVHIFADGSFRFEPADGFVGTETIHYRALDHERANIYGTITIEVLGDPGEPDGDDSCPDRADCEQQQSDVESDDVETPSEQAGEPTEAPPAPARVEEPTFTG